MSDSMNGFEWDPEKALENERKHGVTFDEAVTIFSDPRALTIFDEDHSTAEDRFWTIGISGNWRILLVVHCDRSAWIRIISARRATAEERELYESGGFSN